VIFVKNQNVQTLLAKNSNLHEIFAPQLIDIFIYFFHLVFQTRYCAVLLMTFLLAMSVKALKTKPICWFHDKLPTSKLANVYVLFSPSTNKRHEKLFFLLIRFLFCLTLSDLRLIHVYWADSVAIYCYAKHLRGQTEMKTYFTAYCFRLLFRLNW
jgi:hypothetical protein